MLASSYWSELSLRDFSAQDMSRVIAVLPVAAIEQHGPHLPLGVDAMIMEECLCRAVARRPRDIDIAILPIQKIGVSIEHQDFSGTLTLSGETAARMLHEIIDSVIRTGVRKIILMNSHGGNSAIIAQLAVELRVKHAILAVTCSWSRFGYPDGLFSLDEIRHGVHGGEIETSLMLAFRPDLVDMAHARNFNSAALDFEREFLWLRPDRPAGFGWMAQDLSHDGAMGDASKATAAKGEAVADYWVTAFIELLRDVNSFDIHRLQSGTKD